MSVLRVATCQFGVSGDVAANARAIQRLMRKAHERGADVVHFCEAALSGYAGSDLESFRDFDWDLHRSSLEGIMALARKLRVWVVLGSSHRLSGRHKPHNSLYVIDDSGDPVTRYDKRFCTGSDLKYYSPGSAFTVFDVGGVPCGALICYDFRFQELYREYYKLGVRLMLHSFYNARADARQIPRGGHILGHVVPATISAYAANNHMWISATNSSGPVSHWAGFFVQPDGRIISRLARHRTGLLVSTVDTNALYYDAPRPYRERAIRGILHSGTVPNDPRSRRRRAL